MTDVELLRCQLRAAQMHAENLRKLLDRERAETARLKAELERERLLRAA